MRNTQESIQHIFHDGPFLRFSPFEAAQDLANCSHEILNDIGLHSKGRVSFDIFRAIALLYFLAAELGLDAEKGVDEFMEDLEKRKCDDAAKEASYTKSKSRWDELRPAEAVRGLRAELGLSRRDLAREIGVTHQMVSVWEQQGFGPTVCTKLGNVAQTYAVFGGRHESHARAYAIYFFKRAGINFNTLRLMLLASSGVPLKSTRHPRPGG